MQKENSNEGSGVSFQSVSFFTSARLGRGDESVIQRKSQGRVEVGLARSVVRHFVILGC